MLKEQRKWINELKWYEWIMVLSTLIPGVAMFDCYLETLILVVSKFTQ